MVNADAQGRFSFVSLSPASYKFCANQSGMPLLDPCAWSIKPPTWNLRSNGPQNGAWGA